MRLHFCNSAVIANSKMGYCHFTYFLVGRDQEGGGGLLRCAAYQEQLDIPPLLWSWGPRVLRQMISLPLTS